MITRIAPTPSGFLHLGNAVDFRLVDWLARAHDGTVVLRIDDMDTARSRPEYVDDVFVVLDWLGIEWTAGPRDAADFAEHYSLAHRLPAFRAELDGAIGSGLETYACECSRSAQQQVPSGGCVGGCRGKSLPLEAGRTSLRVHVPADTMIDVGGRVVPLADVLGDFVVWRRDGLPAYQLASVVLDRDLGVTHVVRGVDLIDSTAAQLFLAPYLDAAGFASATFAHHDLVSGPDGRKLSKSRHDPMAVLDRSPAGLELVDVLASRIGGPLGIRPVS